MCHITASLILMYAFPTFTGSPEKIALINSLPANVRNLLTDIGFDANLASENDLDTFLESLKDFVTPVINP